MHCIRAFPFLKTLHLTVRIDSAEGRSQFVLDAPLLRYQGYSVSKAPFSS